MIKSDGSTTFETDIVITEKGFSVKEIEELTSEFVRELKSAGWQVEKKWLSRSEPFKLSFLGKGNIHKVENAPDFYKIQKVNEKTYSIRFIPAETKGGKSSRSIRFKHSFFGGAKVIDERGNEVKMIENVLEGQVYKIVFHYRQEAIKKEEAARISQYSTACSGKWQGNWTSKTSPGYLYEYSMVLEMDKNLRVTGQIHWLLKKSPQNSEKQKIGLSGIEFVKGTGNIKDRTISLVGFKKDDPNGIIGLDNYELILEKGGKKS